MFFFPLTAILGLALGSPFLASSWANRGDGSSPRRISDGSKGPERDPGASDGGDCVDSVYDRYRGSSRCRAGSWFNYSGGWPAGVNAYRFPSPAATNTAPSRMTGLLARPAAVSKLQVPLWMIVFAAWT